MFRLIKWLFLLALIGALAVAGALYWYVREYIPEFPRGNDTLILQVTPGEGSKQIAQNIKELGIDADPNVTALLFRIKGADRNLKAGRYELRSGTTIEGLVDYIISGRIMRSKITFIEGQVTQRYLDQIANNPDLEHPIKDISSGELHDAIGAPRSQNLEGRFAPDTYTFANGINDTIILRMAYDEQRKRLKEAWDSRDPDLTLKSPTELLILASLIEKETGVDNDRKLVSSVFHNRLKKGMMLQTDPSVIYGIKDFDGVIRRSHLKTDTPYNTYTRTGLPPTPIANPGKKSLEAAAHPAKTNYLYFVAKGEGASHFSSTLGEHNRAVQKYLRSQGK